MILRLQWRNFGRFFGIAYLFATLSCFSADNEDSNPPPPKEARECKSKEDKPGKSGPSGGGEKKEEDACKDNGEFKKQEKEKAKDQCGDDKKPCCCKENKEEGKGGGMPQLPPIPDIPCGSDEKKTGLFQCKKVCSKMTPPQQDRTDGDGCMPICEGATPYRDPKTFQCMGTPYLPPLPTANGAIKAPQTNGNTAPTSGVKK